MDSLVQEAISFANSNGILVNTDDFYCHHAPLTLVPTKFSKKCFENAISVTSIYNALVEAIANDSSWIFKTLEHTIQTDDFTRRLVGICRAVEKEGLVQNARVAVNRSDYMVDGDEKIFQIELNTIASSFGCLSARVSRLHHFMLSRYADNKWIQAKYSFKSDHLRDHVPLNAADKNIAGLIAEAANYYSLEFCKMGSPNKPAVLFVVQEDEKNTFDQRFLEYELWEKHGIQTLRKSLTQLAFEASLVDGDSRRLYVNDQEISVVYFRAGYTPVDYPTETEWSARLTIERSLAIKCPCIQYHLVGTKKIQQELAIPGTLERFLDPSQSKLLRSTFAGLWSLGDDCSKKADLDARNDAIEHPENYVVKPQREGGGNNLYGAEAKKALMQMDSNELAAYILMERIFPREVDAVLIRQNEHIQNKAIQELGIYGLFFRDKDGVVKTNEQGGHLLRTKRVGVDEGGVASGYSYIDSPFLI